MREVATDYNLTPEAIARQSTVHTSLISLKADDYWVDIPNLDDDDDGFIHYTPTSPKVNLPAVVSTQLLFPRNSMALDSCHTSCIMVPVMRKEL